MTSLFRSALHHRAARRIFFPATAAAGVLLLAGCSVPADTARAAEGSTLETTSTGVHYPLELDNCGTAVSLQAPPERVVTIKSTSTELLLALGLGDRIVGTAFSDGPVPQAWDGDAPPVLAGKVPSLEAVLSLAPDLIFAGWESNFSADGAGQRSQLTDLGVQSYVSPAACQGNGYRPSPLTFDDVFASIEEAGDVFGAPEAAAELVREQRTELDAVVPSGKGYSALWYSSGSDTPFVGAGSGAPALLMEAAGLENIADGIDAGWSPYSWEAVAEADPDVIVLVDSAWGSTDKKKSVLEAHPVISQLAAVREGRYLVVPFAASEAGVRNVETVRSLSEQLAALD
ncbi:putative F420-0 ABC transporter substrate-binding protein [Arthrobacter sp. zg-Y916]|uniref:putative F420-0 ABC transporter substrate-binding protein n=1 Tax=Arthrobacter sp. zg-Y916 TaxID=2894190 RepID=UPI001E2AA96D|nr:putative F420-0 ABC transporter substrate-binding protein [Arthrobacter sp. zg-Y916]MCC9193638.1 putative F420-0 ABC transporter substrate-binding protein [Arthrobacter sp. zg-Y916]